MDGLEGLLKRKAFTSAGTVQADWEKGEVKEVVTEHEVVAPVKKEEEVKEVVAGGEGGEGNEGRPLWEMLEENKAAAQRMREEEEGRSNAPQQPNKDEYDYLQKLEADRKKKETERTKEDNRHVREYLAEVDKKTKEKQKEVLTRKLKSETFDIMGSDDDDGPAIEVAVKRKRKRRKLN